MMFLESLLSMSTVWLQACSFCPWTWRAWFLTWEAHRRGGGAGRLELWLGLVGAHRVVSFCLWNTGFVQKLQCWSTVLWENGPAEAEGGMENKGGVLGNQLLYLSCLGRRWVCFRYLCISFPLTTLSTSWGQRLNHLCSLHSYQLPVTW